ncbi:MAG TPA: thiol reductant ABC exporter subunit CydC [Acidiferrobacter sp.]|nr:thiol reductant ABC exporter subunit CydC [Acidiferrobacter sp.]
MRETTKTLRQFWALMRPYRARMAGGAALALVAGLSAVGLMAVAGWFIAAMALAGTTGVPINYFSPAAAIRAFAILRTGGRYGERLVTHDATMRSLVRLRTWLLRRLIPLAPAQLSSMRSADLMARLRADIDALEHFYLAVMIPFGVAFIGLGLVFLISLAVLPLSACLIVLGAVVTGIVVPAWTRWRAAEDASQSVYDAAALRGLLLDALRGHAELTVWGGITSHNARIASLDARLAAQRMRLDRVQALGGGMVPLAAQWSVLGLLGLGLAIVHAGGLSPIWLVMLSLLVLATYELITPLPEALAQWQATVTAAQRVFDLADTPPAVLEPADSATLLMPPWVRYHNVRLRYREDGPWALDCVDFALAPGAHVAIVGAPGAGKSSLLGALQKFFPTEEGFVEFGGAPLAMVRGDDLRQHMAVIAQYSTLFNRSLLDNLLLAAPDADAGRIHKAIQLAQLEEFVRALPQGYHTILGEAGGLVSGGEARRIVIAQTLLKDAPVLILDEPTEGLDAQTADDLLVALETAARGRTVILVTHRLAGLARLVDEVIVMEGGRLRDRMPVSVYMERSGQI